MSINVGVKLETGDITLTMNDEQLTTIILSVEDAFMLADLLRSIAGTVALQQDNNHE